jgi:hypothetical protein
MLINVCYKYFLLVTQNILNVREKVKYMCCLSGQRLLAQYAKDSNWYRVRVTNVDFNTPNQPPKVEINYIDYGNSEVVHPDRLVSL